MSETLIPGKNVCSDGWHAPHGSTLTLKNPHNNDVTVKDSGVANCPWPFYSPAPPFVIQAYGTQDVVFKEDTGKHCYTTEGCPDDIGVNPKTVIIS